MNRHGFPVGVHHLHDDTSLDFQLNRLATLGGGRLEEVREAAPRIRDLADWKREFLALAKRAEADDRKSNAAAYLRAAEFFMAPGDPDKAAAYERQAKLFRDLVAGELASGALQEADAIAMEEIRNAGLYDDIWQAFVVLLPVKTVGVMGDGRTYDYVVGLRAVTSTDGMTADFYQFDMKFLGDTATRIINEVKGVNRVVYDVTSKPPGTIEWE